jgi:hemerythrin
MGKIQYVEWDSQYSVGVPEIDRQHKKLMKILNATINHSNGNKIDEKKYFRKIRRKVEKYLKKHFEKEEKILAKTNYEKLEEHKAEHTRFYDEIIKSNEEIENNIREINLFYSTAFVKEWLLNHIKNFDKKAETYIMGWARNKRGVPQN